jgi:SAM-dependent methyltransferase
MDHIERQSSTELGSGNALAQASFGCQRKSSKGFRAALVRHMPIPVKQNLRFLQRLSLDAKDLILGRRRGELVPPHYLNFVGDGDFEQTGQEFLRYFIELGRLKPEDRVLEVGCGIGRMAGPLTKHLVTGSYEGIDIVPRGIRWASQHISSRYPNFRFQLADIYNLTYNPRGRLQPTEYQFPFADGEFDLIFLTSVFTHMLTRDVEHYLREIARTLRPNGRCLITYFLLNNESNRLIRDGLSSLNFQFHRDGCRVENDRVPENVVAFEEASIRALYESLGFAIETVRYGAWPGRTEYLSYQDIIVAQKNSRPLPKSV